MTYPSDRHRTSEVRPAMCAATVDEVTMDTGQPETGPGGTQQDPGTIRVPVVPVTIPEPGPGLDDLDQPAQSDEPNGERPPIAPLRLRRDEPGIEEQESPEMLEFIELRQGRRDEPRRFRRERPPQHDRKHQPSAGEPEAV